jgi:hypothetical protein
MIEVNDKELQIEVKEILTWGYINEFFMEKIKRALSDEDNPEYDEFIHHDFTIDDKKEILNYIVDSYQEEEAKANYYDDCNVSIYDKDVINNAIITWIEEEFDIEIADIIDDYYE